MKYKKYYLKPNCFWRPDYDAIFLSNQASFLRLNQKAGVIFYNYIIKKNNYSNFYNKNNISESEIADLLFLLESEGFISLDFQGDEMINPISHITI